MKNWMRWNLYLGLGGISTLVLLALFAPYIVPHDPFAISLKEELCLPSQLHWLGCDSFGGDILSILLYGARLSLFIGLSVTTINISIGLIIGSVAGYFGGFWDILLMRILDIVFAFPGLILAIGIAGVLGPSKYNLIIALTVTGWAGYARLIRGEVLALREKEFIYAASAIGLSSWRIIIWHIWPNLWPSLSVAASFGISHAIIAEASLSFLGIGVPVGTPSWGTLLNYGRDVLVEAPHVACFAGLSLLLIVLSFNFLGEGIRARIDPNKN